MEELEVSEAVLDVMCSERDIEVRPPHIVETDPVIALVNKLELPLVF